MGGVVILSLETVTVFVYRYYINELYYPHWLLVWHGVLPCDDAYAVPNSKKPSHALLSATCPDAMLENTKQSVTWPEDSTLGVGHWTQRISNLCTAKHWHFRLNQGVPVTKLNNADVFICRKHMLMKKIFNFPPIIFSFFPDVHHHLLARKISSSSKERKILERLWEMGSGVRRGFEKGQNESATYCCLTLGQSLC